MHHKTSKERSNRGMIPFSRRAVCQYWQPNVKN